MKQIDILAFHLANTVNAIHRKGHTYSHHGNQFNSQSTNGTKTNVNFFESPIGITGAAKNLELSQEVKSDLKNIVTALGPNSPGDNRISIAISKLQDEKILADGSKTLEEEFLGNIGNIGLVSAKTRIEFEQSEGILAQMNSIRERIVGVSIDEEAANMVKYQQAYDASAKVLRAANEMFDSVLGIVN